MTVEQVKTLNTKKDEILSKCLLLDKNEHSYVIKAYSIINQLLNKGISIPESLLVDSFEGHENGFIAVYSDNDDFSFGAFDGFYCTFDTNSVADYSWAHGWVYVDFDGLKSMDFQDASVTKNYGLLGEKEEDGAPTMAEDFSEIDDSAYDTILDTYNYLLKAAEKYSKDRADWFDRLQSWMGQNDIVVESTEIVGGIKTTADTVKSVVENILKGTTVRTAINEASGQKVFLGRLDRFGYDLTCIDTNKVACEKAILAEYEKAYRRENDNLDPRKSFDRSDTKSDYAMAKEDIEWDEMTLGVVEWD